MFNRTITTEGGKYEIAQTSANTYNVKFFLFCSGRYICDYPEGENYSREALEDEFPEVFTAKRYRDESGKLTMSIAEIAAATLDEANRYYIDGGLYMVEGRGAIYHADVDGLGLFESSDEHKFFVDPDRLGTFLPDVADDDLAIVRA